MESLTLEESKTPAVNESNNFYAVIRHGERADHAGVAYDNEVDPPLTKKGIKQAQKTSIFLQKLLDENKYDKIIIQASPFTRCIQTASTVAQNLGVKTVEINYLASEYLSARLFKQCPMKKIDFWLYDKDKKLTIDDFKKKHAIHDDI